MKRLVLLLFIMLSANLAYGQHNHGGNLRDHGNHGGHGARHESVQRHSGNRHNGGELHLRDGHGSHHSNHVRQHSGNHHSGHVRDHSIRHHSVNHHHSALRREIIRCLNDWQELWNGYHVRIHLDRVYVCNRAGDRILQGDEVILLPNGFYKVRNGDFWRVYDERGERVFEVWGDEVILMDNGLFRCYRAGMYFYYDERGNRVQ